MILFEVTTATLQRWIVAFPATVEGEESTPEQARDALDACIAEGIVLDARVPHTVGDDFPWRINAAYIVAYEPSDEELKPRMEEFVCRHSGDLVEVPDPSPTRRDDTLKYWKCLTCEDTFPLIGDTDMWEPKTIMVPVQEESS